MKKIVLLTMVAVLVLAMPVLAVEGEVSTGVEIDDVTGDDMGVTLTYLDGNLDFAALMADDFAADLSFLVDSNEDEPGEINIQVGPTLEFTGVEYLTTGIEGGLEDDYMLAMLDAEDDAKVFANLYANVEVADMVDNLTFGANNNLEIRNVEDDDDNPFLYDEEWDVELNNYLTLNPFANYEMAVDEELTVGAENDVEIGLLENEDIVLTIKPYANYAMEVAPGMTAGANNSFEFQEIDGDTQNLEIAPFFNVDTVLAPDTTLVANTTLTVDQDFATDADEFGTELHITNRIEHTGIDYLTLGVAGAIDDDDGDEDVDDEWIIVPELEFDDVIFATEIFANVEYAVNDEVTVGSNNNFVVYDNKDNPFEVVPFANYNLAIDEALSLSAGANYTLVDGDIVLRGDDSGLNSEFNNGLELEATLTYSF